MGGWFLKFLKFGTVGGLGMVTDFALTWLCKEKLMWNKYVANAIGFSVAVTQNYILNRIWTFESADPDLMRQFFQFFFVSLVGLFLNTGIIYFLHNNIRIPFYLSKLMAIAIVVVWNFLANYFFTFQNG